MIRGLDAWVNHLERQQLPLLAQTLQNVMRVTADERTSVNLLSDVILKDPDLCSEVLKLANSVCFNPTRNRIDTISRAVVTIGFDSVKSIVVSALLVDQLVNKGLKQQVYRALATSVHAAVQARAFAAQRAESVRESVFLAALLYGLGETAVWASGTREAEGLLEEWRYQGFLSDEQQRQMLGTTFVAISRALAKNWKLGALLEQSFSPVATGEAAMVQAGVSIARFNQQGWLAGGLHKAVMLSTPISGETAEAAKVSLNQQRERAAQLAVQLGIARARELLLENEAAGDMLLAPDFQLQLQVLQALCEPTPAHQSEVDTLKHRFDLLLKGVHKGVGLERVGLFVGREGGAPLQLYRALGQHTHPWQTQQTLALQTFAACGPEFEPAPLRACEPLQVCVRTLGSSTTSSGMEARIRAPFGGLIPALVALLPLPGQLNAVLYADRLGMAPISLEQQRNLQLLAQQFVWLQRCAGQQTKSRQASA